MVSMINWENLFNLNAGAGEANNKWIRNNLGANDPYCEQYILNDCTPVLYPAYNGNVFPYIPINDIMTHKLQLKRKWFIMPFVYQPELRQTHYYRQFSRLSEEQQFLIRMQMRCEAFMHQNIYEGNWTQYNLISYPYKHLLRLMLTYTVIQKKAVLRNTFDHLIRAGPFTYVLWKLFQSISKERVIQFYHNVKKEQKSGIEWLDAFIQKQIV